MSIMYVSKLKFGHGYIFLKWDYLQQIYSFYQNPFAEVMRIRKNYNNL